MQSFRQDSYEPRSLLLLRPTNASVACTSCATLQTCITVRRLVAQGLHTLRGPLPRVCMLPGIVLALPPATCCAQNGIGRLTSVQHILMRTSLLSPSLSVALCCSLILKHSFCRSLFLLSSSPTRCFCCVLQTVTGTADEGEADDTMGDPDEAQQNAIK